LGLFAVAGSASAVNFQVPAGTKGTLVISNQSNGLNEPGTEFGLVQRDANGNPTYVKLTINYNTSSSDGPFYRVPVKGGEVFEFYARRNATGSDPNLYPFLFSSDPTKNTNVDGTQPEHLSSWSVGTNSWNFSFDLFNHWYEENDDWVPYGDDHTYFGITVQATCDNVTVMCPDKNIILSGHATSLLNYTLRFLTTAVAFKQGAGAPVFAAAEETQPPPADTTTCGSHVDNYRWSYAHEAVDWSADPDESKCACGGCGSSQGRPNGTPKQVVIKRYNRPKYEGFSSSFGMGGFSNYDIRLEIYQNGVGNQPNVVFYDPSTDSPPITFYELSPADGDNSVDGYFHDTEARIFKGLTLTDAAGYPTGNFLSATSAVLDLVNGDRYWFEVFPPDDFIQPITHLSARIYSMQNRNGYSTGIAYQFAANSDDATLNYDRTQLWNISYVIDPYGHAAYFNYLRGGASFRWMVNRIDLPTGYSINYQYGTTGGGQDILTGVTFPDGSTSAFSKTYDSPSQTWDIAYNEVADGPSKHLEDAFVTGVTYVSSDGVTHNQAAGLVRRIANANGEVVYQNWEDPNDENTFYVQNGSDRLSRYRLSPSGAPLQLARATSVTSDPLKATYVVDETYFPDSTGHLTEIDNGVGAARKYVLDPATRQVTGYTRPDGSSLTVTLNAFGSPLHQVNETGLVTDFTYDGSGNLLTMTEAVGTAQQSTWTFTYNYLGEVTQVTNPLGKTSTYTYDRTGQLVSITDPPDVSGGATSTRSFEYDGSGFKTAEVDESGRRKTFSYDSRGRLVTITYPDLTTETVTYGTGNLAGLIVKKTDRTGKATTFTYDASRRPLTDSRAGLDVLTRQYVPGRDLLAAEISNGERTEYTYDSRERVTTKRVYVNGTKSLAYQTAYDAADRATTQTDPYGRRTFYVYDADGRQTRKVVELIVGGVPSGTNIATLARNTSANPPFVIEDFAYDARDRMKSRTDGRGNLSTSAYDILGRRTQVVEASGTSVARTTNYAYDLLGNLTSETLVGGLLDGTSLTTSSTYTGRSLLLKRTVASGTAVAASTSYTYSPTHQVLTVTDPRGGVTQFTYNSDDRRVSTKDPAGFLTTYVVDPLGRITRTTDPLNNISSVTYDGIGRLLTKTNGAGEVTSYQYDDKLTDGVGLDATYSSLISGLGFGAKADGQATLTTNAAGETTLEVLDGLGRRILLKDGNGNVVKTGYDTVTSGLLATSVTNALGKVTTDLADRAGRVRQETDADGKVSTRQFDAAGNQTQTRDANSVGQTCVFDALSRRTSCTDTNNSTTSWEYDRAGDVTATTDPLASRTTCVYDAQRRVTSCVDRTGSTRKFAYDAASNATSVTDGDNGTTTYTYDARNLRTSTTYPDATTDKVTYTYDADGQLSSLKDQSGNTIGTGYDRANRMTTVTYPDGSKDTVTYDKNSRVVSATSGKYGTVTSRTYDTAGRLNREVTTIGGRTFTVGLAYDAANHLTTITYPDNSTVSQVYGIGRDLPTQIKNGASSIATYTYDNGGRLTTTALGNGQTETTTYQADDLIASITAGTAGTVTNTYDADKRRLTKKGTVVNGDQTYAYDKEDRLTSWTGPSLTQSWSLSNEGDWKSTTRNGTTENRTHNAVHQISTIAGKSLTYDARGNITVDDKGDKLSFDLMNRLLDYTTASGTKVTYAYDAFGRKVASTVGSTTTNYVYAGSQVIAEYTNGTLSIKYINGRSTDHPVAYIRNGSTYWYTLDDLGSVLAVTNSSGTVVERYRYTGYGDRTVLSASGTVLSGTTVGNQIGFTGRPHDSTSGLIDFRFRQYDPRLGRFISRDSKYTDGLSLYAGYFVPNSTDPTGHGWGFLGDIGGAIVDGATWAYDKAKDGANYSWNGGLDIVSKVEDWGKSAWYGLDNLEYGIKGDADARFDLAHGNVTVEGTLWAGIRYHYSYASVGLSWQGSWTPIQNKHLFDGLIPAANCPTNCCAGAYLNAELSEKLDGPMRRITGLGDALPGLKISNKLFVSNCTAGYDIRLDWNILSYALPGSSVVNRVMGVIGAGELTAGLFVAGRLSFCWGLSSTAPVQVPGASKYTVDFKEGSLRGGAFIRAGKFSADSPTTTSQ